MNKHMTMRKIKNSPKMLPPFAIRELRDNSRAVLSRPGGNSSSPTASQWELYHEPDSYLTASQSASEYKWQKNYLQGYKNTKIIKILEMPTFPLIPIVRIDCKLSQNSSIWGKEHSQAVFWSSCIHLSCHGHRKEQWNHYLTIIS